MKTLTAIALFAMILTGIPALQAEPISADKLILLPVANDPTVAFRIWFAVGSQNDPAGKEGLAALTAAMVTDAATQAHSYEQILDLLFPLASEYSASTSAEMTVVTGRTHRDNLAEYYPLLMNAILKPAFRQDDLERLRSQVLNHLENELRYSSDEELGKALLYSTVYAGTRYGHTPAGMIDAVRGITLDDIRAFYTRHYTRATVSIGLGGGYDQALLDRLRADLGSLPAGAPPPVAVPKPADITGRRVVIIDKDAPATAISMGFPMDVLRGSREWYALAIANSWLGEHRNSSSHLYQVIREARGLNYGDYSYIEHFPNGGRRQMPPQNVARRKQLFEIWIRPVPHDARHFALRAAVREFTRLVEGGMTAGDFELTRGFLRKYVLHYAPTTMERLGYAIDDRFYGISGSHLDKFRTMMEEITLEEVNAAMKKHWHPDRLQIAVVTKDAAGFRAALAAETPSPLTYATPKPAVVLEEDREIIGYPLKIRAEDVKIITVEEMFVAPK